MAGHYEAKVTHVDRTVEPNGKTVRIFAEFDNPQDAKPAGFAQAQRQRW